MPTIIYLLPPTPGTSPISYSSRAWPYPFRSSPTSSLDTRSNSYKFWIPRPPNRLWPASQAYSQTSAYRHTYLLAGIRPELYPIRKQQIPIVLCLWARFETLVTLGFGTLCFKYIDTLLDMRELLSWRMRRRWLFFGKVMCMLFGSIISWAGVVISGSDYRCSGLWITIEGFWFIVGND